MICTNAAQRGALTTTQEAHFAVKDRPAAADGLDAQRLRYVDAAGTRTRVYEDGTGVPLVLIHGGQFGFVDSLDAWSRNLPALAARFRVHAIDKLGQGHTDNPAVDGYYTFEALVRHAVETFRVLGIEQAHVVGHSRGALLAAQLALHHPGLVRSVVFVDSNTLAPDDPRYPTRDFYAAIARRTPAGPPTRETVRIEKDANSCSTDHVTEDFITRLHEIALLPKTQEAQRRMQAIEQTVWMPSVERHRQGALRLLETDGLSMPALVVWALRDPSAPLPLGVQLFERLCARTKRAEMHVLDRAGHYPFRELPEEFDRVLTSWCAAT
jgi:2-hydroxy-6-oxonona-2,4-dienedioate hydrolase